jgi:hypothetical protein
MLAREAIESIRSIFLQHVQPVTVDFAAKLLGWDLDTMDAAVKWRAVTLDENSLDEPRIAREELLRLAVEQWTVADILRALGRDRGRVVNPCRRTDSKPASIARDALAMLPPPAVPEPVVRRVAAQRRRAHLPAPLPQKQLRRRDGVREFTVSAMELAYQTLMPYFRVRGRWLAQLGFKPGMRLYIQASRGQLVITTTDPAAQGSRSTAPANVVSLPAPQGGSARRTAVAAPAI